MLCLIFSDAWLPGKEANDTNGFPVTIKQLLGKAIFAEENVTVPVVEPEENAIESMMKAHGMHKGSFAARHKAPAPVKESVAAAFGKGMAKGQMASKKKGY